MGLGDGAELNRELVPLDVLGYMEAHFRPA